MQSLKDHLGEDNIKRLINYILRYLSEAPYPPGSASSHQPLDVAREVVRIQNPECDVPPISLCAPVFLPGTRCKGDPLIPRNPYQPPPHFHDLAPKP